MSTTLKQLGQVQPTVTTAVLLFSPATAGMTAVVKSVLVCNTTASAAVFSLYHDVNGYSSYTTATALFYQVSIPANSSVVYNFFLAIGTSTGQLGVQSGTASALTITAYGAEQL